MYLTTYFIATMFDFIKDNLLLWIIIFLLIVSPQFLFGVIGVFAYIILAILLLIIVGVLVLRWRIRRIIRNQAGTTQNSWSRESRGDNSQKASAKVFQTDSEATKKRVSPDVGDYVDFEEIKD